MKSEQIEEETILDSEIDEFDIEEMTEKFRKWMITNRDRFLVDFENPKGKLKQDEKFFNIRFAVFHKHCQCCDTDFRDDHALRA